jgi:hypothetical protein
MSVDCQRRELVDCHLVPSLAARIYTTVKVADLAAELVLPAFRVLKDLPAVPIWLDLVVGRQ